MMDSDKMSLFMVHKFEPRFKSASGCRQCSIMSVANGYHRETKRQP
jgi:hypothetical protein